ncbi:trans-sulfuration enzyme family protein [Paenibacillus cremeus]|uniref:homocysteine desulfhydrase n=1 Tax=Paenibacillus cremeus TaxID=2163881 RepID=A0A559K7I4_9BACL|nr:PLP-dependent aspartate aminotransferase family protein [Paenibacillus cremeus]TVY08043.1 PLP-dependent transferase [Paenibacillus cremeus]
MRSDLKRVQEIITSIDVHSEDLFGAVVPPTFENTIYRYPDYEAVKQVAEGRAHRYGYSKNGNPTTEAVERVLAALEKGEAAKCFSSGTAAIYTVLLSVLEPGSHVITVKNVYGRTSDFLKRTFHKFNVQTTFVSGEWLEEFEEAIQPNTRLIYLESPTSWQFELQPIRAVSQLAKQHGIKVVIDNTWATPVFQNPLELGADAVIHSASKYLGGHSDLVAGVVIGPKTWISDLPQLGAVLSPYESAKLLRGVRTLALRMERHEQSALRIAAFLEQENKVTRVNYPGLASYHQYELAQSQMSGCSGLMSFHLDANEAGIRSFIDSLRHISIGGSWGGFESILYAAAMSGTEAEVTARGFGFTQIRLSVGLEVADTLLEDLHTALQLI